MLPDELKVPLAAAASESWRDYPCDEWDGTRFRSGYGKITIKGKQWLVHRLEWTLKRGPIPPGICVCHHCDNPPCREINHLWLGTRADYLASMRAKGRGRTGPMPPAQRRSRPRGEQNPAAKLTEAQVREICERYAAGGVTYQALADEFGVHFTTIAGIVTGKHWQHTPVVRTAAQPTRGEQHPGAKLTRDQVDEIRRRYAAGGISNAELAAEYGVVGSTISGITSGKYWRAER